jgi:hypothetical protein
MVGGLMNLSSYGSENIILTGNPTKTMFKAVYHKYTNFGMQRFRLDYDGLRNLSFTQEATLKFTVKRYGDLIGDTYIVLNLPDIWSPFFTENASDPNTATPYEFRWIENLGVQMIKNICITAGGSKLQEYPGEYLYCMVQRDYNNVKKDLWNKMIGNIPELNDPGNANGNINTYPNAAIVGAPTPLPEAQPSIKGRQLYIPIDAWFCGSSKLAMPLVALQYQEIQIEITFRPLSDLYTIADVETNPLPAIGVGPRIAPNPNNLNHQIWRFLQSPPTEAAKTADYENRKIGWNADIHLMANYYFLDNEERDLFARSEHKYLIRNPYYHDFLNATGSKIVDIPSRDMVSNYMWRFRRSDANLRNEWSNYSNWPYNNVLPLGPVTWTPVGPTVNPGGQFEWTQTIDPTNENENIKNILIDLGIVIGGNYREVVMPEGTYNLMEKYIRTTGNAKDGLYCYNFCLDSNQREYQPSGAMNMNKFKYVQFEYNTIEPPIDPNSTVINICDGNGNVIGVRKSTTDLYEYNYDLRIFEERYNMVVITSGNIGLLWAK